MMNLCDYDGRPLVGAAEKRAIAWAFEKLAEEHLYWAIVTRSAIVAPREGDDLGAPS